MGIIDNNDPRRLHLAEEIANEWNKMGIPYAVVNGLRFYPKEIGRDLDIAVKIQDVKKLSNKALEVGKAHGFSTALMRWSHWGLYQLVLLSDDLECSLPLDFLCTESVWRAKAIWLMDSNTLERVIHGDDWLGPFRISREGQFYKTYLRTLLCGDIERFDREYPLPVEIPINATEKVKSILGNYINLLTKMTAVDLKSEFPNILWKMQINWVLRHPLESLKSITVAIKSRINRHLFNPAEIIVISADDIDEYIDRQNELISLAKKLFIELKIVPIKHRMLYFEKLKRYLNPPVSEFVVILLLTYRGSKRKTQSEKNNMRDNSIKNEVIKTVISRLIERYNFDKEIV